MPGVHHHEAHTHPDTPDRIEATLDLLRSEGSRVTIGRRAIVTALLTADDHHLTAEDVAKVVQDQHPDVHVSTIYRTLETLERLRVIDRVSLGSGGAVYHPTDHTHHHLICEVCGAVIELGHEALAPLKADLEHRHGFTVSANPISLNGRCRDCTAS